MKKIVREEVKIKLCLVDVCLASKIAICKAKTYREIKGKYDVSVVRNSDILGGNVRTLENVSLRETEKSWVVIIVTSKIIKLKIVI